MSLWIDPECLALIITVVTSGLSAIGWLFFRLIGNHQSARNPTVLPPRELPKVTETNAPKSPATHDQKKLVSF